MVIKIESKHLIKVLVLLVLVIASIFGYRSYINSSYEKNLRKFQKCNYELFMTSSYACTTFQDHWQTYIFDDAKWFDNYTSMLVKNTYMYDGKHDYVYCSSINKVFRYLNLFYRYNGTTAKLDSLYDENKVLMKKLIKTPSKFKTIKGNINTAFHVTEDLYKLANMPEGNFRTYSSRINDLVNDYKRAESEIELNFGEISQDEKMIIDIRSLLTVKKNLIPDSEKEDGDIKKEGEEFLKENAEKEGVVTTPSGLQYKVIKEGKGEKPTADSRVKVMYKGTLIDGTEFDSSKEPVEFRVGSVIKGWQEALTMMPVGSKWMLYIPYDLGYGERGTGANIKPYSTLIFEIELFAIVK